MKYKKGYVAMTEVETEGTDRCWFCLTKQPEGVSYVDVATAPDKRAWFTFSLESSKARPVELAKVALLMQAMNQRQMVRVGYDVLANVTREGRPALHAVKIRAGRGGLAL